MSTTADVAKLVPYVLTGPGSDQAAVTKLVMYVWAVPGESTDTTNKQGHTRGQLIVRAA